MKIKVTFLSLFLATLLSGAVDIGDQAPSFSLTDIKGEVFASTELAGRTVVLEWINPQCPFVKKFYTNGEMVDFQNAAKEMGVVWISISSNRPGAAQYMSAEENLAWAKSVGHEAIWLMDPDGAVGQAYGAQVTPHMFVINPAGEIVYQGAIDSVRDASPGSIAGARNYVMEALTALDEGRSIEEERTRPYGCGIKY
jgi:peroxiredoxin